MRQKIDKQLVRERFGRTLATYNSHAVVQKTMALELVDMIFCESRLLSFERVLEIGSGSGMLTAALLRRCKIKAYHANDLVAESVSSIQEVLADFAVEEFHFLAGDIENLAALPLFLDLVVSNATLQWLEDLDVFFKKISFCIRQRGLLAFSSFSTLNMQEISTIEETGLSYYSLGELKRIAGRYFDVITCSEKEVRMEFASPEAVLHHIRQTGVNGLFRRSWTKSQYQHFLACYRQSFSSQNGVYLTYHPVYCLLRKKIP
ncbi:MAG: malonyl-ACP O-methyltransferase BioC [Chlorobiaceae bacterium]